MKGTVKWFNNQKGYGFITGENRQDVFVHYSSIVSERRFKNLYEGQTVEFEVVEAEKGRQAVNVHLISNDDMEQEKLTEELANIIKENYENGIFLLDSNYEFIKFDKLLLVPNIIRTEDMIHILQKLRKLPEFKKYCEGMIKPN